MENVRLHYLTFLTWVTMDITKINLLIPIAYRPFEVVDEKTDKNTITKWGSHRLNYIQSDSDSLQNKQADFM